MDGNTILAHSDNATFEVVADEAILIHMTTGTYFSLNKVGTEFWEMLDGRQTISDHAAVLAAKYEVDPEMVTADLIELAGKMVADDLVVTAVVTG